MSLTGCQVLAPYGGSPGLLAPLAHAGPAARGEAGQCPGCAGPPSSAAVPVVHLVGLESDKEAMPALLAAVEDHEKALEGLRLIYASPAAEKGASLTGLGCARASRGKAPGTAGASQAADPSGHPPAASRHPLPQRCGLTNEGP